MTSRASTSIKVSASETGTNTFGGPNWSASISHALDFTDGTTANKIDLVYIEERTVASGANDDIDLSGVLTTALGTTFTAAELVFFALINEPVSGAANTTDLTIGAGSNPFLGFFGGTSPTIGPLKPGGVFVIGAGDAAGIGTITAGTADILRIANSSGASAKYQIALFGRTA